jgi:hypothetical protein
VVDLVNGKSPTVLGGAKCWREVIHKINKSKRSPIPINLERKLILDQNDA